MQWGNKWKGSTKKSDTIVDFYSAKVLISQANEEPHLIWPPQTKGKRYKKGVKKYIAYRTSYSYNRLFCNLFMVSIKQNLREYHKWKKGK